MYPVDYVNDPYVVGKNDNLVSINSCVQVDFMGQVAAESVGTTQISGIGGQMDFIRGARLSKGGRAVIAIASTAAGGKISKIVPFLDQGAAVTTSRTDVDYIVTEYGIAHLRGKTLKDRARALISIAHPKFREELAEAFEERFHCDISVKKIQIIYSDKKRGKEYGRGIQNYRKNTGGVCPAQAAGTRGECRSRGYKRESGIYKNSPADAAAVLPRSIHWKVLYKKK